MTWGKVGDDKRRDQFAHRWVVSVMIGPLFSVFFYGSPVWCLFTRASLGYLRLFSFVVVEEALLSFPTTCQTTVSIKRSPTSLYVSI